MSSAPSDPSAPDPATAKVIDHLYSLKAHGPHFGIDRMRVFCAKLGEPQRAVPCVHIAGTNGKGSVAAMVEAAFREAGWRVGLYTSPHLVRVGERVQVNREPLSDEEVAAYAGELRPTAERIAAADPHLAPSFFEYLTAIAFLHFARQQCDVAVIEVGLGGRLDATNVVDPTVTVITSIGLDHCEMLGDTLEKIAAEKAGIVKPAVPLVLGRVPAVAEEVMASIAAERGAPVVSVAECFGDGGRPWPETSLSGEYQRWNAATATLAIELFGQQIAMGRVRPASAARVLPGGPTASQVATALRHVVWAGRWQFVRLGSRQLILDASHNPEGASVLERNLAELVASSGRRPIVIVGVLGGARARPLLEAIARYASEIHLVVAQQPRACSHAELRTLLPAMFSGPVVDASVDVLFPDPATCAVGSPDDIVVVTGSIYLLGEVMQRIERGIA
jgi:dihydrofolate synthase/folylpolyglutamate synthase